MKIAIETEVYPVFNRMSLQMVFSMNILNLETRAVVLFW